MPADSLGKRDADGITLREALTKFGGDPERLFAMRARGIAAFIELHIEQGPVLEAEGLALGTVGAINGATRLAATVQGLAGHAGAVPMVLRQDALAAAAEMILAIEARARKEPDLVATVGRIDAEPGAINVIPGLVRFSDRYSRAARRMAASRGLRHRRGAPGYRGPAQDRSRARPDARGESVRLRFPHRRRV